MNRFILSLTVMFIMSNVLNAQIVTDRPDQTESSTTIPKNSLQVEMGFGTGDFDGTRISLLPTALFRYGIFETLELRLAEHVTIYDDLANDDPEFGLSDMEVGFKLQVLRKEGVNSEIAFISHLILPTGSPDLTNSTLGTVNKVAISHTINDLIGLGYNLGYNYFGDGNGDLTYSAALSFGLSDKFGMFVEPFGEYSNLTTWTSNLDGGLTYLLKDNFQLDFSLGVGLNHKMNFFAIGFSWNNNFEQSKN